MISPLWASTGLATSALLDLVNVSATEDIGTRLRKKACTDTTTK